MTHKQARTQGVWGIKFPTVLKCGFAHPRQLYIQVFASLSNLFQLFVETFHFFLNTYFHFISNFTSGQETHS